MLPVYQKSLLDEEIAQRTLELRDQEKRVRALNGAIQAKEAELAAKDQQVLAARNEVRSAQVATNAAKSEARSNYIKLRQEHLFTAMTELRRCESPFADKALREEEFAKCPAEVMRRIEYLLADWRKEDVRLLSTVMTAQVGAADSEYKSLIADHKERLKVVVAEIDSLEKQEAAASTLSPAEAASTKLNLRLKLIGAQSNLTKVRLDSIQRYRNLLAKVAREVSDRFNEKAAF
ncbi:hypothetical protein [Acidovorax sp.]|uniref:hypothetical protein n=1 Tax=Acidovorax sp. TaxID=1872122 RepID=UPI0025B977F5|nr:hypothetical protein [Acidovorax sp.]MBL7088092.1 hypothetical protein [Acidovorax sp.]